MRRLTEDEVRERIRAKHGDRIKLVRFGGGSHARSDFRCTACGCLWTATTYNVASGATGCRDCAQTKRNASRRVSGAAARDRIRARHGDRIELVRYAGRTNDERSEFRCAACGHEWVTSATNVMGGRGCARCSKNLKLTQPEVTRRIGERHQGRIVMLRYGGGALEPSDFRCEVCGHEWSTHASNIYNNGKGCARCHGNLRLTEAQVRDRITARHRDSIQLMRYGGSFGAKSTFCCSVCGHEWATTAGHVVAMGTGCPPCAVRSGAKRMRTTEAEARERILERHGGRIEMTRYGGRALGVASDFRCNECGYEWSTAAQSVYSSKKGCGRCAGVAPLTEPEVRQRIAEAHSGQVTLLRYAGRVSGLSDFRCNECQHEWSTSASNVMNGHGCGGRCGQAKKGMARRLPEDVIRERVERAHIGRICLARYSGTVNTNSDFECRECGCAWSTKAIYVFGDDRVGCPSCTDLRGFDRSAPGRVYLIYNLKLRACKVGVTTAANDRRLKTFAEHGWRVFRISHHVDGGDALAEERRILNGWREAGIPEAVTEADMPMGGWTETAPLSALPGWELLLDSADVRADHYQGSTATGVRAEPFRAAPFRVWVKHDLSHP